MSETAMAVQERLPAERSAGPGGDPNAESVDLGQLQVQFKEGDPCRPRYEILYRYHFQSTKEGQIEPAFQIASSVKKVSMVLSLASNQVEFVPEDDLRPLCRELGQKAPDPNLEVKYLPLDKSRCSLAWAAQPAMVKAFRIYCRKKGAVFTDEQKTHGGIIVVFSTHPAGKMGKEIKPLSHQHQDHHDVHLVGADKHHRPIYDIHQDVHDTFHHLVEIEPAYRLRPQQKALSFRMIMKIHEAQWKNEVKFPPPGKPEELQHELKDGDKRFEFQWTVKNPQDVPAKVCNFHLVPKLPGEVYARPLPADLAVWGTWESYAAALEEIGTDPVIIQPPTCDPVFGCVYPNPSEATR